MGPLAIGIVCLAIGWAVGRFRRADARLKAFDNMVSASGRTLAAQRSAKEAAQKAPRTAQLRREIERSRG